MKYPINRAALLLSAAVLLGVLSSCGTTEGATASQGAAAQNLSASAGSDGAVPRTPAVLDLTDATVITLSGRDVSIEGDGASEEDGVITITAGGVYALSGTLSEGRILVNAPGEEVTLALNGADITCSYGSPLYIYKASSATVHLMEGTENALTDGDAYTFADAYSSEADEEPNACLYSKADLVIEGAGSLTVTARYNNGITSKDTLQIYDGTISVSAANHGVNGKDSNTIDSAVLTVNCGGDAVRATNDTDETLGWVSISNSTLDLTAGEDGIQGETAVTLSSGSYTILSGGGSGAQLAEDASAKGIKAGTALTLASGVYSLDCADDALHANGDVTVSGGVYTVSTGDDAFHADGALTISGGEIAVLASYEGLEGSTVAVSGGTISIVSSDDGVNAAGGADGSGFGGFGRGNTFSSADLSYDISISGGYLVIQAGGDGLDSNGTITLSGGTVVASSSGRDDGALDCEGTFTLTGGTLLAISSSSMSQTPGQVSQYTVSIGFDSALPAGSYVCLSSGGQSFVFQMPVEAAGLVFSSPDLEGGAVYTVSCGGSYSGETADGICTGGSYSGGTDLTELTLSDYLTAYGSAGMGGPGGMGGRGGAPGERPDTGEGGESGGQPPERGAAPSGGGQTPTGEGPGGGRGGRGEEGGAPGAAAQAPSSGGTPAA